MITTCSSPDEILKFFCFMQVILIVSSILSSLSTTPCNWCLPSEVFFSPILYSLTFLPAGSGSFSGQSCYQYNFAALFRFHPFFLHDQSNIIVCLLWSRPYFCPGMVLTVSFLAIVRPTRITFLRVVSNSSSFFGIC